MLESPLAQTQCCCTWSEDAGGDCGEPSAVVSHSSVAPVGFHFDHLADVPL